MASSSTTPAPVLAPAHTIRSDSTRIAAETLGRAGGGQSAPPRPATASPGSALRALATAAYLLPALALYGLFVLWPLARLAVLSFQRWDGLTAPAFDGLDNYRTVFSDPGFPDELRHTLLWLLVTLTVPALAGLALALLLHAMPPVLRTWARALLILPLVFPTVLIAVCWKLFYNPLSGPLTGLLGTLHLDGLAQDWLGDPTYALPALLVLACWASFGLSMLLCEAALGRIDPAVLAAASLDGAGGWARLRWITLPALRGALPLATVVTGLCAVPSYDLINFMTHGGPGYATTTLSFDAYGRAFGGIGQVGEGAALACLQGLTGLALALVALLVACGQGRADSEGGEGGVQAMPAGCGVRRAAGALGLLAVAVILAPLAWLVALAFRPADGSSLWATLGDNLGSVGGEGLGGGLLTSAGVATSVAIATLALAIPAAFALSASRSRLLAVPAAIILAVGLFQPTAVLIIPLFHILEDVRLLNSAAGLILPQVARVLPIAVLLLWIGMRGLSAAVLEAAAIDGSAPRQVLWYVALPLQLPLATVVGVWAFLTSWNDYLLPTVSAQDGSLMTAPMVLGSFIGRSDTQYALLATGALLALLPLLVLYAGSYGVMARGVRGLSVTLVRR